MESRQELQLEDIRIEADLLRRTTEYVTKLLGNETRENRKAYENNRETIATLLQMKREYRIPKGSYLFSTGSQLSFQKAEEAGILAECIFVFGLREYKSEDVYEQYLMHLIQIGTMNAVRDYMQEVLVPQLYRYWKKEQTPYVSEFFGPGLFEEPLTVMRDMVELTKVTAVKVADQGEILIPDMSFAGVLYVTGRPVKKEVPCISCKAKIGCEYCMKKR